MILELTFLPNQSSCRVLLLRCTIKIHLSRNWRHYRKLESLQGIRLVTWPFNLKFPPRIYSLPTKLQNPIQNLTCWLVVKPQINGGNYKLIGHVTSLTPCKDSKGVGGQKKLTHGYEIDRKCAIWKRRFSRNTRNLLRPQAIQEQLHKSRRAQIHC